MITLVCPAMAVLRVPPSLRARRWPRRTGIAPRPLRVREWINRYDDEGSEARSLGSVSVGAGAWWSVALTVPGGAAEPARDTTIVRLQRHGPRADEDRGDDGLELVLPSQEVGALVTLLAGVVAQARRDGVLPAARP